MILQRFTQFVKSKLREGDMLCRYGGDEFVILFDGDAFGMAQHLNTVRAKFAKQEFESNGITVTIGSSWGVMPIHREDLSIQNAPNAVDAIKHQVDEYMLAVKYWRFIGDELINNGKILPTQEEKNGVAIPVFAPDGTIDGIKVLSDSDHFMLSLTDLEKISQEKKRQKDKVAH